MEKKYKIEKVTKLAARLSLIETLLAMIENGTINSNQGMNVINLFDIRLAAKEAK